MYRLLSNKVTYPRPPEWIQLIGTKTIQTYVSYFHNKLKCCKGAIIFYEQQICALKTKYAMFTYKSDSME